MLPATKNKLFGVFLLILFVVAAYFLDAGMDSLDLDFTN